MGSKYYDDDSDERYCLTCGGSGEINECWDDLCANSDECIHGDGVVMCRACQGSGITP